MDRSRILARIHLTPMPSWPAGPLRVGLQSARAGLLHGVADGDGMRFEAPLEVRPGPDGWPDFAGPLVHGKRGERFLYLCWAVGDGLHAGVFRRLKLYLSPLERAAWSQPGLTWADLETGVIEVEVGGRLPDGTPACGTAPARWTPADPRPR